MRPAFRALIPALSLLFCGFAVTAAGLMPRDCEVMIEPNDMPMPALLAGVKVTDCATVKQRYADWLGQPGGTTRMQKPDRYGRSVIVPSRKRHALQEELLRDGLAVIYDAAAAPKAWQKAEAEAQQNRAGIWRGGAMFLAPEAAGKHLGEFVFVTGRITRSYKARDMIYLNFGDDWREDFSVSIARRDWRAFKTMLDGLDGKTVRVRGVIMLENGPMIRIIRPEQLEILA